MIGISTISIFVVLLASSALNVGYGDEINPGVVSKDSKLFGKSYGEWAAAWWQWFGSIPKGSNPGEDTTGQHCSLGQNDPNMWFLIESFDSDKYVRSCTIPSDRHVFVPSLAAYCDTRLDKLESEQDLAACAQDYNEATTKDFSLKLDERTINSVQSYRVTSPLTNFTYPENNVLDEPAYASLGVVDGFFVILEPLPIGNHRLHIQTIELNPPKGAEGKGATAYDVFYNLTVR